MWVPIRVGIGEKSLAKGEVMKPRAGAFILVKADEAVSAVKALVTAGIGGLNPVRFGFGAGSR